MSELEKYHKIYSDPNTTYGSRTHGKAYIPRILELKPQHMIDVGCGQNLLAAELRQHDINVIGLDPAAPQADYSNAADNIPFPDNAFDLLTAFDVLEHIPPSDVPTVLTEFRRVLTPTGKALFIIAMDSSKSKHGDELHPTRWSFPRWKAAIEKYLGPVAVYEQALSSKGPNIKRDINRGFYVEVHL